MAAADGLRAAVDAIPALDHHADLLAGSDDVVDEASAIRWAELILSGSARRLYGL